MIISEATAKIFIGSDFPVRDFTYVDDTARAFIAMIGNKKSIGEVTNVGFGKGISVKELSRVTFIVLGKKKIN